MGRTAQRVLEQNAQPASSGNFGSAWDLGAPDVSIAESASMAIAREVKKMQGDNHVPSYLY
jgi:hypothetical protein